MKSVNFYNSMLIALAMVFLLSVLTITEDWYVMLGSKFVAVITGWLISLKYRHWKAMGLLDIDMDE